MGKRWKTEDILTVGEDVVYQCELKSETEADTFLLTNHRLIVIGDNHYLESILIKNLSSVMMVDGFEDWGDDEDIGDGEYAIRFYTDSWETIWFYSEKMRKEAYDEIIRAMVEE